MPSKNSINKPKDNLIRRRKSNLASKRRQRRSRQTVAVIQTSKGTTAVVPLSTAGGVIANTVISNKKARKLERNLKYAQLRREGASKKNGGDVEMVDETQEKGGKHGAKESAVRKALWTVVETAKVSGVPLAVAVGEGTTLGGPSF